MFRRAMKRAVTNTMRSGALGVKVRIAGRLNGAEISRSEWTREGRIPLHTFRAEIDYGTAEARKVFDRDEAEQEAREAEAQAQAEAASGSDKPAEGAAPASAPEPAAG
jgi:small subunit ribosomal protein S3